MLRIITLSLIALLAFIPGQAQRYLETVRDPANPQKQSVVYNGKVLIAGHADSFLLSYNDVSFTSYNYPILGSRLKFDSYHNPLVLYNLSVFLVLKPSPGSDGTAYLYRFNGTSFFRIVTPGPVVSNCVVYGTALYFLCRVSSVTRMYLYNGTSVSEVTGASIPNSNGYQLHSTGGYLYASGYAYYTGTYNFIRRYNGTTFFTLPHSGTGTNVESALGIPGSTRVYFTSHERILYYNGSTVTEVFYNAGEHIYPKMWRSELYFTTGVGSHPSRVSYLYKLSGPTLTNVVLPTGSSVAPTPHTNPEVFNDNLYVGATNADGTLRVLRYNGAMFFDFFNIPGALTTHDVVLFIRDGVLIIQPRFGNGNRAFEHNAGTFTEIKTPLPTSERLLFDYINSTACNHLWLNYYSDKSGIHWAYAKEKKDCPPPPPPGPVAVPVIPAAVEDFERVDITAYGPDRGWCWSEIIIDWEIVPYCPLPPCPLQTFQARMTDANNGIMWSAQTSTPGSLPVTIPDQQPLRTTVKNINLQTDFLVFEPELVPSGIGTINLKMLPKQNYFLLTATTDNNQQVPLKVTLLGATGKVLWQQVFTAPFSQQITATVQERGQMLVFSGVNL